MSPELVGKLLQQGATFGDPPAELLSTAEGLRAQRIITTDHREFVRCANPEDKDYPPKNRHCNGRIYVDRQLRDSGEELWCPECERRVFPHHSEKRVYQELRTRLDREGIMAFLIRGIEQGGIEIKLVVDGVLRLDVGPEGVTLCVVDFCEDPIYLARERAIQNPTCFVAVTSRDFDDRFLKEEWVVRVALADLICGRTNLNEVIQKTAVEGRPQSLSNASIAVYEQGPSSVIVEGASRRQSERRFVVEVGNGIVRIEGIKIVAEQAGPRFILFQTLWHWFLDDLRTGVAPEDFRTWPLRKLIEELESQSKKRYPDETTVRRVINNMQNDFEDKLRHSLGLAIDREDIVETRPWSGQGDTNFGYRINPLTVAARPFQLDVSQQS